jgi:hypothetical protein
MSHPDNNSHQRAYKERMVEKGFRQLTIWVHDQLRDTVKQQFNKKEPVRDTERT